jgi:type VI secretion system protein ImpM
MSSPVVGYFGKLPSHGDFIERRVAERFREVWDEWLQRSIQESHQALGNRWLDCYLTSPIWRFYLSDGIAGSACYTGVLMPSVDRVGRYFPFTVVAELPLEPAAIEIAEAASGWYAEVEQRCVDALENTSFELAEFDEALAVSSEQLRGLDQLAPVGAFPGRSTQWRWPLGSIEHPSDTMGRPLLRAAQAALRPMTMWWTAGSELVAPSVLLVRSLPRAESFAALIAGTWNDGAWQGDLAGGAAEPASGAPLAPQNSSQYVVASGGASDVGGVRQENQDQWLANDGNRMWAVADGMGGHSHGEVASQMVVDALNDVPPTATLNAALESISGALTRVNTDLRRMAGNADSAERIGSTVVALVIRGAEWAVSWAGDSRAYVVRDGHLIQLTRDHAVAARPHGESDASGPAGCGSSEITRAVGGEDTLELDSVYERLAPGDRFLLCSDGLYGALNEQTLASCLQQGTPAQASRALVDAACATCARDNVTAVVVTVEAAPA